MMSGGPVNPTALPELPAPSLPRRRRPSMPVIRVLPGTPEAAGLARSLAREVLGDGHPATETVLLVVSELVTNAVLHSQSGAPGGTVLVVLCPSPAGVLVQVRDNGGPSRLLTLVSPDLPAEHGYGLLLVDALSDSWGTVASTQGRVTWCRVSGANPDGGSEDGDLSAEFRGGD